MALIEETTVCIAFLMTHDLVIFVRLNDLDPTAIRISPYATIQSLEAYLPDSVSAAFYLDGQPLSRSFSLIFSGVTEHSVIDVVTCPIEPVQKKVTDPHPTGKAQDRMVDQFYDHLEGTTTSYRRLVNRFLSFGARPSKRASQGKRTIIPEGTDQPATDELPHTW
jgi:hypothetical protein